MKEKAIKRVTAAVLALLIITGYMPVTPLSERSGVFDVTVNAEENAIPDADENAVPNADESTIPGADENASNSAAVNYIDAAGNVLSHDAVESVTQSVLGSYNKETWYVVDSDLSLNDSLRVVGNVNLILADGKELKIRSENDYGIYIDDNSSLTVYSQSTGSNMGKLNVEYCESCVRVGNSSFVVNGGNISINAGLSSDGIFISNDGNMTVNNGMVSVSAGHGGVFINSNGSMTVNNGVVSVSACQYGVAFDRNSNMGNMIVNGGNITIAGGAKAVSDETKLTKNGGTVTLNNYEEIQASVLYIDETGTWQSHLADKLTDSSINTGSSTNIDIGKTNEETWYVVDGEVSFDRTIAILGDVNLILADDAQLNITPIPTDDFYGVYMRRDFGSGSLTIYSQSTGENMGKMLINGNNDSFIGIQNNGASLVINGGEITTVGGKNAEGLRLKNSANVAVNGGRFITTNGYDTCGITFEDVGTVTLGYNTPDDSITIAGFNNASGGTVIVKDGQKFTDGENFYSGTLTGEQQTAISGKKLTPTPAIEHAIIVNCEHGTVTPDKSAAAKGDTVTLNVTPELGYVLSSLSVTDASGAAVDVSGNTFIMPDSDVTVSATFAEQNEIIYINENGEEVSCTKYAVIDDNSEHYDSVTGVLTLPAGTYVVSNTFMCGNIMLNGDVNIVVSGGCWLYPDNVYGEGHKLNIYSADLTRHDIVTNFTDITADSVTVCGCNFNCSGYLKTGSLTCIGSYVDITSLGPLSGGNTSVTLGYYDEYVGENDTVRIHNYSGASGSLSLNLLKPFLVSGSISPVGENDNIIDQQLNPAFSIVFDSNGGEPVDTIYYTVGSQCPYFGMPEPSKDGAVFAGWYDNKEFNGEPCNAGTKFEDKNYTLYAKWEGSSVVQSHAVNISDNIAHGEVSANKTEANPGDTVTLTVTPADGYAVKSVTVNGAEVTKVSDTEYTFEMPDSDAEVSVEFIGKCGENAYWEYNADTGEMVITGSGDIPNFGKPEQTPWYALRDQVISIEISDEITHIGNYSFWNFNELVSVKLPEVAEGKTMSIGDYAFYGCTGLTSVIVPDRVNYIDLHVFENCTGLKSVFIPDSLVMIREGTFDGCTSLSDIYYKGTEQQWNSIDKKCKIPGTVHFGALAAYTVTWNNWDGTELEKDTEVPVGTMPAYYGDTPVREADDRYIYTFSDWDKEISAVTGDVTYTAVFESHERHHSGECGETAHWELDAATGKLIISGSGAIPDFEYRSVPWYELRDRITSVEIGDDITCIGNNSFRELSRLTSVNIPESVTSIGEYAFDGCISLTSLIIPDSVENIGICAFVACTGLTSVTIPRSVKSIGESAFAECMRLSDIYYNGTEQQWNSIIDDDCGIPDNCTVHFAAAHTITITAVEHGTVTADKSSAVQGETVTLTIYPDDGYVLNNITVTDENGAAVTVTDNTFVMPAGEVTVSANFIGKCGVNAYWEYNAKTGKLTISGSGSITDFGYGQAPWYGLRGQVTSVVISDHITHIGNYSFCDFYKLTYVVLPKGYALVPWGDKIRNTSIGNGAFRGCTSLKYVDIPDSVKTIDSSAFEGCSALSSITIPNSVVKISDGTFIGCTSLTTVNIPDSVNRIEGSAFQGCTSLSSITIPNGVSRISLFTFKGCSSLTTVNIPDSVNSIEGYAFQGCTGLSSITIPESVTAIGTNAFNGCTKLKDIRFTGTKAQWDAVDKSSADIPEGCKVHFTDGCTITTIAGEHGTVTADKSFAAPGETVTLTVTPADGYAVKSVTVNGTEATKVNDTTYTFVMPDCDAEVAVEFIGKCGDTAYWEFDEKRHKLTISGSGAITDFRIAQAPWYELRGRVTSIEIGVGITHIGNFSFGMFSNLASVKLPQSVTSIGKEAFSLCRSLENVTIPAKVNSLGERSFSGCSNLKSIVIPVSVKNIKSGTFNGCTSLSDIYYNGTKQQWASVVECDIPDKCKVHFSEYAITTAASEHGTVTADKSVAAPGDTVKLTIKPDYCYEIKAVTVNGTGATKVSDTTYTFKMPDDDAEVAVEFEFVGYDVLFSDRANKGGTITADKTKAKEDDIVYLTVTPDDNCVLNFIKVRTGSIELDVSINEEGKYYFVMPANYVMIDAAFDAIRGSCGSKTGAKWEVFDTDDDGKYDKLVISGSGEMTKAGWGSHSENLNDIEIGNGITTIGDQAFQGCTQITSVIIPAGVTKIGGHAFDGCSSLTTVVIPDSVTKIQGYAFNGCTSLESITIPEGVTTIGQYAFNGCSSLGSITIPKGITKITPNAFSGCSSLETITIPEGVTRIDHEAFNGCSSLESITIPDSVTAIGHDAFNGCSSLESITIPESVTTIEQGAFTGCTKLKDIWFTGTQAQWNDVSNSAADIPAGCVVHYLVEEKEPTCEETGNIEYYGGTDGSAYLRNTDGSFTETTLEAVTKPATEHAYAAPVWSWTQVDGEYTASMKAVCAKCGKVITYPANVSHTTADGIITYTASVTIDGTEFTTTTSVKESYSFDVVDGTITKGEKESYSYDDAVTVTAQESKDGKYFSGWYIGETPITTKLSYTFYVKSDMIVTAKYDGDSVQKEQADVSVMINRSDIANSKQKVVFALNWALPAGCRLKEAGIVRRYGSAEDLKLESVDGSDIKKNTSTLRTQNGNCNFILTVSAATKTKTINAVGYVIYIDKNGVTQTAYSEVQTSAYDG